MSICQIYDLCAETLWLGRYGENGARDIAIDVGGWFADLGAEGTVVLVNWRPGEDDTPYNPNVTMDGSKVVWSPSNIDLAISGRGFAELRYYVRNALAKSKTFRTVIDRTPSEGANPPSAAEDWLERMEDAAVTAQTASETAVTAAETATEGAQAVAQALPTVTQAAQTATSAATTATNAATEAALSEEVASAAANAAQTASESATAASQTAVSSASTATTKAAEAVEAAGTATTKASEATQAATTATANAQTSTAKAGEATTAAATATAKATEATTAASTASAAATTATSAASTATAAKTAAETARTGAETAQTAAESAAASVTASAEQIETNKQDITELKADLLQKANIDGAYSDLTAGNAEQLVSTVTNADDTPYNFRTTAGSADVGDRAYVDAIVGATVAWNQIVQNGDFADSSNWSGGASLSISDGVATYTATGRYDGLYQVFPVIHPKDHVYFMHTKLKTTTATNQIQFLLQGIYGTACSKYSASATEWQTIQSIEKATLEIERISVRDNRTDVHDSYQITDVYVVDITKMFGTAIADYVYGLESAIAGAGVAWFRKLFPADYYPYDTGTLKSVDGVSAHETVGFNQWDEEWEVGAYSNIDGTKVIDYSRLRCKDKIPCVPNTAYFYSCNTGAYTGNLTILFYDADENFISYYNFNPDHLFTTPDNCHYMTFYTGTAYGMTYKNDICINLSDPAKNGTYEPYVGHVYPLDSSVILRGIPKLADGKLYYDGDRYLPDGKVERRYGIVDLGTLNWTKGTISTNTVFYNNNVSNIAGSPNASGLGICAKYEQRRGSAQSATDKQFVLKSSYAGNSSVLIVDNAYTDAAAFKSAMSGVMLVYELATPTTEEATPYRQLQICDPNGTEEFVSTGIVPVGHETRYPENLRAKIEGLPWDFSTLIAPTETGTASRNYTVGSLLIMGNVLYKVTANIANGGTITPGTNVTATTLSEVISALQ